MVHGPRPHASKAIPPKNETDRLFDMTFLLLENRIIFRGGSPGGSTHAASHASAQSGEKRINTVVRAVLPVSSQKKCGASARNCEEGRAKRRHPVK
jgi:hypothetical protein